MRGFEHEVGRIDFAEPLERLLELGWGFREGTRRGEDPWVVFGVQALTGRAVRGEAEARLEAWAKAVRLAQEPGLREPAWQGGS